MRIHGFAFLCNAYDLPEGGAAQRKSLIDFRGIEHKRTDVIDAIERRSSAYKWFAGHQDIATTLRKGIMNCKRGGA